MPVNIILGIYGILMLVGGFIGYKKAGSMASLIAGGISGVLILIAVYIASNNPVLGYRMTTVISGLLVCSFTMRLVKTGTFMPSGMLLILSVIALVISLKQIL